MDSVELEPMGKWRTKCKKGSYSLSFEFGQSLVEGKWEMVGVLASSCCEGTF